MLLKILQKITRTNIFWALLIFPSAFLAFTAVLTYYYFIPDFSDKELLMNRNNTGIILLDKNKRPFFSFHEGRNKTITPIEDIPPDIQNALIASEDREFYKHSGFSFKAIIRAVYDNIKHKSLVYGGSTITQQLTKNALLSKKKYFFRKYQEIILSELIESRYSKKEILEMYLNSVYFGEGAFGIEDAAKTYFNESPQNLTLAQSTLLIGLLPAPSEFSPISGSLEKAKERQSIVLDKMTNEGYIPKKRAEEAKKEDLGFNYRQDLNRVAAHFALMVKRELLKRYTEEEITRSGFKITTTLDLDWQLFAEDSLEKQVNLLKRNKANNAAAVVADPKNGEIRALVGSYSWYDDEFGKVNVTESERQPGSSFKPIFYAKALEEGIITPATILNDVSTTYPGGYKPRNYDGSLRGRVTVRYALANSLNIPAVEVINKVGIKNSLDMAWALGITTLRDPDKYGLSLALGAGEVKLLEMTEAYAVFANYGLRNRLTIISQIENKKGEIIYRYQPAPKRVLSPGTAFLISSILSDKQTRSAVFGTFLDISRIAAVKTGTTENYRDAWTMGYTPTLVVGVWVGNNDGRPMDGVAGSLGAAPIWKDLMEEFLKDTPFEDFTPPPEVKTYSLCLEQGSLPREATRSALPREYFLTGTQPPYYCFSITEPSPKASLTPSQIEIPTPTNEPSPVQIPTPTYTPVPTPLPSTPTPRETPFPETPTPKEDAPALSLFRYYFPESQDNSPGNSLDNFLFIKR